MDVVKHRSAAALGSIERQAQLRLKRMSHLESKLFSLGAVRAIPRDVGVEAAIVRYERIDWLRFTRTGRYVARFTDADHRVGFDAGLLALLVISRLVQRQRWLALHAAIRDGALPTARTRSALIDVGPGVDPADQERTAFDCLAAADTFRENDDLSGDAEEGQPTPADAVMHPSNKPTYDLGHWRQVAEDFGDAEPERTAWRLMCDAHNTYVEWAHGKLCELGRVTNATGRCCWIKLPINHGTALATWSRVTVRESGWLKHELGIVDLGANESGDEHPASVDPAQPVFDYERGIARKQRRHEPLPAEDIDFFEVEVHLHQWFSAVRWLHWQHEQRLDVHVEVIGEGAGAHTVQSRWEDLVIRSRAVDEGLTALIDDAPADAAIA